MKRIISVLLAFALFSAAAVLSGCSDSSHGTPGSPSDSDSSFFHQHSSVLTGADDSDDAGKVQESRPVYEESFPLTTIQQSIPVTVQPAGTSELMCVNFTAVTRPVSQKMTEYSTDTASGSIPFSGTAQIPSELCNVILSAMSSDSEASTISGIKVDTALSEDDFYRLTGAGNEFSDNGRFDDVKAVMADVDNDGITDILARLYGGGTGGFCEMVLFRGNGSTYTESSSVFCFLQDFSVIMYGGKSYLLITEFDYNTKYYNGFSLYLYDKGVPADGVLFTFAVDDYDMSVEFSDSGYLGAETVSATLCDKRLPSILAHNNGVIYGTAETAFFYEGTKELTGRFKGDLNNDGYIEDYTKVMWYPSNISTVQHCNYAFNSSSGAENTLDNLVSEISAANGGELYTFWLDKVNGENVLYLYFGCDVNFTVYAYLLR